MILCIETNKVMKIINDMINYAEPLICLFNKHPTVHIDWNLRGNYLVSGECGNPSDIYIYPMNILYIANKFNWAIERYYGVLCETIVHELFHINQYIDYARCINDSDYTKMVEDQVDVQTTHFMIVHLLDILNIVGSDIIISFDRENPKYQNGSYDIRYFGNHIKSIILEFGVDGEDTNVILHHILVSPKYYITVNGIIIPIKLNGTYYDIDDINEQVRKILNYKYIHPETCICIIHDECADITVQIDYGEVNSDEKIYNWIHSGYNIV